MIFRDSIILRPRGETDITTVFGTVVAGSSPAEGTNSKIKD